MAAKRSTPSTSHVTATLYIPSLCPNYSAALTTAAGRKELPSLPDCNAAAVRRRYLLAQLQLAVVADLDAAVVAATLLQLKVLVQAAFSHWNVTRIALYRLT